jgi:predicted NACHT family NTPase
MPIDPLTAAITATVTWIVDKYGEMFVDKMAEGVAGKREDRAVRKQWQQATTTYLQKLHDEVNNLRVLGKLESQPLEQIYTDVNVLSKLSAERRYRLDELEAEFIPRRRWLREESERRDGLTVATETQRLFILGKPGAGKTTFLKHVALRTIKENAREDGDKKLPIFVTLKEQSDSGQELVPFIAAQFARADFPEAETFVRRLLKAGDAVVLLDGLDEVNLEGRRRARLITAIKQFVHEFDRCRILLTCRVAATDYSFERFAYVEMADFDRAQQQRFIYRWFQEDMAKRDNCWQALQASRNDTLQELAQNPLLLSLLCVTFEERNEFPAERSEIYREATQALLGKWDARRNIQRDPIYQSLSLRWREGLLAYIAAQTFGNKVYFIPQRTLVRLIEKYLQGVPGIAEPDGAYVLQSMEAQHGLLVERAKNILSFSHLTLQEYFTAHYIVANEARGSLPRLMAHVGDDRWREVFLLTAAMLDDATDFAYHYLATLDRLAGNDQRLLAILRWNAAQNPNGSSDIPPPAVRAIGLLFLAAFFRRRYAFTLGHIAQAIQGIGSILGHDILGTEQKIDVEDAGLFLLIVELVLTLDPALATEIPKSASESLDWLYVLNQRFGLPWKEQVFERHVFYAEEMSDKVDVLWQVFTEYLDLKISEDIRYTGRRLTQYLNANLLLLECLDLAYVPDRQAIVDRLLLPPG